MRGQRLPTALMVPCPGGMPCRGDREAGGGTGRSLPGDSSTRHRPHAGDSTAHTHQHREAVIPRAATNLLPPSPGDSQAPLPAANVTVPPAVPAWAQPLRSAHQPWHRRSASRARPTPAWRADGSGTVWQRRVPGGGSAPGARGTSRHRALPGAGRERGRHPCHRQWWLCSTTGGGTQTLPPAQAASGTGGRREAGAGRGEAENGAAGVGMLTGGSCPRCHPNQLLAGGREPSGGLPSPAWTEALLPSSIMNFPASAPFSQVPPAGSWQPSGRWYAAWLHVPHAAP